MLWMSVMWAAVLGPCWLARGYDLTAEDQDVIVERHNYFRSVVQPTATNMRRVSWDESLARMAAGYVTKCVWEHNPDLKDAGENLYATNGPFSASQAVTGWYLEHLDYSYHNDTCEEDKLCGHYTQVVWSHTTFVGCSTHLCEEVAGLTLSHVTLLVCNYFPPGNYEGVLPYEEGEPCSNCPNDLHCEGNICVDEPPSATEGTTEGPQPGTDGPSITESPAMETDKSPVAETDGSPTAETDGSPTAETEESASPSDESLHDTDTGERDEGWENSVQSVAGPMPHCSSALLFVTLVLLTL